MMDDDIKIAPETFKAGPAPVDYGEEAARQFLEQKQLGNIDRARELGRAYAGDVIELENGDSGRTQRELHHQLVLFSYIVNRVIAERSPNSIVAQSCLNMFYKSIETASEELYRHVSDMAAYSLYMLCERSRNRSDSEIGVIYAELCDFEGNEEIISEGNAFYRREYENCAEKLKGAGFVE
jgi:hypothetical protein